jgi:hypothetical protein
VVVVVVVVEVVGVVNVDRVVVAVDGGSQLSLFEVLAIRRPGLLSP